MNRAELIERLERRRKYRIPLLSVIAELHSTFSYDPNSGTLSWEKTGKVAGARAGKGLRVKFKKTDFMVHRIAWVIMTNTEAPTVIDHINGDPFDNRWKNLRAATVSQNAFNRTGIKGYTWDRNLSKWKAQMTVNYRNIFLGSFDSEEEAHSAYLTACEKYQGSFAERKSPLWTA